MCPWGGLVCPWGGLAVILVKVLGIALPRAGQTLSLLLNFGKTEARGQEVPAAMQRFGPAPPV